MGIAEDLEGFIVAELSGLDRRSLAHDEDLVAKAIIDSLGILQLTAFMEEKFEITIGPEEIVPSNFRDIDSLAKFVQQKKSQR